MADALLRPVPDEPVLEFRPRDGAELSLIVADLHLGLGSSPTDARATLEATPARMAGELVAVAQRRGATRIIVAGDVKHPIVGTPAALRPVLFDFFSTWLSEGLRVEVVLGNHDVGLTRFLPREVVVHPPRGMVEGELGVFHGHCWPTRRVLAAKRLVVGHLHPGFRFAPTVDQPTSKRRCWVRVRFAPDDRPRGKRRRDPVVRAEELIVLPALNPLSGTEALNKERPRRGRSFLFQRFLRQGDARAYLLDGTDLGRIIR